MTQLSLSFSEAEAKFWARVRKTSYCPVAGLPGGGCWLWTGALKSSRHDSKAGGYGNFHPTTYGAANAHKFSYVLLVGPVPDGLVLDHLCRVRRCVNPQHMEPVTNQENLLRGDGFPAINARKTHCQAGHPLAGENLSVTLQGRRCRICHRAANARWYELSRRRDGDSA